jgi:hypothetical protein
MEVRAFRSQNDSFLLTYVQLLQIKKAAQMGGFAWNAGAYFAAAAM